MVLFAADGEPGLTLLSTSESTSHLPSNFAGIFFAPFSNLIALCNDNFQMNLYNMGTCPTNLIMVTANSSMQ